MTEPTETTGEIETIGGTEPPAERRELEDGVVQWQPAHRPETRLTAGLASGGVAAGGAAAATAVLGALALGALAIGAVAVGALAIGSLAIGRARFKRLLIDDLVVRRLKILEP